jgi:signal transduction histidine kinase
MKSSKHSNIQKLLKSILFLFVLIVTPTLLAAQNDSKDIALIKQLLTSAEDKSFSDTTMALQDAHQALALAQKINDSYYIYKTNNCIAKMYDSHGNDFEANRYFVANISVEKMLPDTLKKTLYSDVGLSYVYVGKMDKAYAYFMKLNQLGITTKDKATQQLGYKKLGIFYREVNDFENSTQFFIKSIALAVDLDDALEICESYRFLTALYLKAKNYDLALDCAEKSMVYVDKVDSKESPKYRTYINYGNTLKECKKYEKAIAAYKKAEILCKEASDKTTLSRVYIGLTNTYNKMANVEKAEFYVNQCATLKTSMTEFDVMYHQNSAGNMYLQKKDYAQSIAYFKQSIALSERYKNKVLLLNNYSKISEALEKNKASDEALMYIRKSVALQESIYSEENTKRLAEAQFKYNLAKSEEDVKTMKSRQFNLIVISVLALLGLLVAFLMYFSHVKNEKNKMLTDKNNEIKDKNRQLEESNEILRQFAYASAHDLKEPLRSINSFVNILQRRYMKDAPVEAHEYMGFVTTGVRRMESLLNALLEFSSVLTNENVASKKNNVPILLKEAFHHYENIIQEKRAIIRYPSVFPMIFMSETHLKQILFNLLSNALKYSKEDAHITIDFDNKMEELVLTIKDNGIGMEKSYSDKIYKLFQRLDKTTHKESVGIGLTICKNIVDKYAGRIWFESVINEGTTFYIAFPKSMISDMPPSSSTPQYLEVKGIVLEETITQNIL